MVVSEFFSVEVQPVSETVDEGRGEDLQRELVNREAVRPFVLNDSGVLRHEAAKQSDWVNHEDDCAEVQGPIRLDLVVSIPQPSQSEQNTLFTDRSGVRLLRPLMVQVPQKVDLLA